MVDQLPEEWDAPGRWRFRCPVGHAHIHPTESRQSAYCTACNESYDAEAIRDLSEERRADGMV